MTQGDTRRAVGSRDRRTEVGSEPSVVFDSCSLLVISWTLNPSGMISAADDVWDVLDSCI